MVEATPPALIGVRPRSSFWIAAFLWFGVAHSALVAQELGKNLYSVWSRLEPADRHAEAMAISIPGVAIFEETCSRSPLGKVIHLTYTSRVRGATFTVSYSAIPRLASLLAPDKTIYRKAKESILRRTRGTEDSYEALSNGGMPGMKLDYTILPSEERPGFTGRTLMHLRGRTLCVFNVVFREDFPERLTGRYFESIALARDEP